MSFTREGMVWLNERLGLAVHIVGDYPTRSEKVRKVDVGSYRVHVIGVEELIIDRLKAAKFWKSERDSEQAVVLLNAFRRTVDIEYLRKRAREENLEDVLPR
jgi:predicted nucleotidyltransferase